MSYSTAICSCGATMLWLKHEPTGHLAPINAEPLPAGKGPGGAVVAPPGNIAVDLLAGTYRVLSMKERGELEPAARQELRLNHFVTCANREQFRRRAHRAAVSRP